MSEESQTPSPNATARPQPASHYLAAVRERFELVAELGSGSSGTVHRARLLQPYRQLPADHEVAIKFLRADLLADERAVQRFHAEGQFGQQLDHDNLAAIHGIETATVDGAEVTFLVMQYVDGTTLRRFLTDSGRALEDLARRIGADAASGLQALHRRELVHRDIKPENLILTPHRQLKIVDLGLVRPFGSATDSGSGSATSSGFGLAGSVAYAAPESLRDARAGPRGDLYSLGVVLYELTTGQHPFDDCRTTDEMLDAHQHREPKPPSHLRPSVSPFFSQVLLDLLQKEPDRRPRDAGELCRILEQGEQSEYWRRLEAHAPVRASRRRLLRMRRPADTAFVGRHAETERLQARFDQARAGRGSIIEVTGPHGSGRRRLCDHLMERWLGDSEAPLLLGGEADHGLAHAEPFASSLLDLLLRGEAADSPLAEDRAAAAAADRFGVDDGDAVAIARVALGESDEDPQVRADRLASALLTLPQPNRPVVLRVDHAEHLDTSGRLVLQRLAAAAPSTQMLVLLTGDCDAAGVAPEETIELGGLDEDAFLEFARDLFRDGAVDDGLALTAQQTMSGVPGNMIEALDHLVQQGQLHGRPSDYHGVTTGLDLRPAPDHLARFGERIATLDAQAREVLSAAAVLGRRLLLADLSALVGRTELAVLEALSLFRGRIVRAQAGEVWFRHRDFRKVLLESIPPETRQQLHLDAAAHLEQRGRGPLEVGMHLSQALDHIGCLDPLLDGLANLVRSGSQRTSLRIASRLGVHFRHVAIDAAIERRLLRYHLLHAEARSNAGQRDSATRSYREAETLARRLDDITASATARTGIAAFELENGHLMAAIAILEGVHDDLAAAGDDDAEHIAARAHGLHSRILLYRGRAKDGHRHLQAALRRLPTGRDELRAHLLIDLARLEALQHHYTTALKTLRRIDKMFAERRPPRVMLRLRLYRGQVRASLGDDEAVQDLRFALDEAERLSLPAYAARAALFLGERRFWRGHDDEAREMFTRARRLATTAGERLGETMARAYLHELGAADDALAGDVEDLALPAVTATWLLARAARNEATASDREILDTLVDEVDLPLSLHLRALRHGNRSASARALVRVIADRIPQRRARRRFLTLWPAGARI